MDTLVTLGIIVVVAFAILTSAIKIVQEYERGVIFRLGRLVGARGPGLFVIIPFIDQMQKMDLRVVTLDVPPQEVISRDNVSIRVSAVVYFRVLDPENAVIKVENFRNATFQIAQTTLRSVLGQSELDELLAEREQINMRLQQIIDEQTGPGESRSRSWKSRTWSCRTSCSGRWPGRLRPRGRSGRRLSTPKASFKLLRRLRTRPK